MIVLDEVQKVPALLDEVHWLIENKRLSFLMAGSSARKLRRSHANLLAGRAWRRTMVPLSYLEVEGFDLAAAMISGMLPPHFLSTAPEEDLRAYTADYLKEEIACEAAVKNLPAFGEFLRVAALTSSELINYVNIGSPSRCSPGGIFLNCFGAGSGGRSHELLWRPPGPFSPSPLDYIFSKTPHGERISTVWKS